MRDGSPVEVLAPQVRAALGEGPLWDDRAGRLYWVDIDRGEIHHCRADGAAHGSIRVGQSVGCIALRRDQPGLIAGLEGSIATIDLASGRASEVVLLDRHAASVRSNDGKCDSEGRFWLGTYDRAGARHGWLYRLDEKGLTRTMGPFVCVNGPAFSPSGDRLYCVDSYGRTVHRLRLSPDGEIADQRPFVRFEAEEWGFPDGLTCDAQGCVWIAHWGGWRVSRFSPQGELLEAIRLPVKQPSSCVFGGPGLRRLFITSASTGLGAGEDPAGLAGAIFAIDVDVPGVPAGRYRG